MCSQKDQAGFKSFIESWNRELDQDTPGIHLKMANWLELAWRAQDTELLLMAFRSSGKSTIAGLFAAWLLHCNPDLRIMVLAAESMLAKKMVRNVKRILERHPGTQNLRPKNPEEWAGDKFTVSRMLVSRDPSMVARGVNSNITGSRADIVICDDVEVPVTCATNEKREALRERLGEISYVLVPGGTQLYIGTPHNYYTIYSKEARPEIKEDFPFLHGFNRKEIPVLNEQGKSAWPERFDLDHLAQIKRHTGPNKFASQMMLQPVNIIEGRLNVDLVQRYDIGFNYVKELSQLHVGGKVMVSASSWWDPAFGSEKGDDSVLACVFSDQDGNHYLHHIEYIKCEPYSDVDEATQQCQIVTKIAKDFMLPSIFVESNGLGAFLPRLLRQEMKRQNVPCSVVSVHSRQAKDVRILEAFDAVLAARRLHVYESVYHTPFLTEMREWRPGTSSKGHDDGLDAVAGALSMEPVRLGSAPPVASQNWMRSSRGFIADTDFKI